MIRDLRHAVRLLSQHQGWTAVVVLSIALGIGANTALFSAVNGVWFRPLGVDRPAELVALQWVGKNDMGTNFNEYGFGGVDAAGRRIRTTFPYRIFEQLRRNSRATLTDVAAGAPRGQLNLVIDGQAEIVTGFVASGNFYQVLGVRASAGRTILPDDDDPRRPGVAVLSDGFWRRRFGGRADVIGKTVRVNNAPVTIVGVTAPSFTGIQQAVAKPPDLTVPLALGARLDDANGIDDPTAWWLQLIGRLKPGINGEQVRGSLEGVFQAAARAGWAEKAATLRDEERTSARYRNRGAVPELRVVSAQRGIYQPSEDDMRSLGLLAAVVIVLLLIVCANVANLLLSRAAARAKEISVRLSLGASRWRLVRQLLTESVLLAAAGGAAGVLIGSWSRQVLPIPGGAAPLDWRLFAFVAGLVFATGLLFGIVPALRATRVDVSSALKESGRTATGARSRLSTTLLIAQVAMSLALLVGAGLFLNTLRNLRSVNVGFDAGNLILFRVNPQLNRYDKMRTAALYADLIERLRSVHGVDRASFSQPALLTGSVSSTEIYIDGRTYAPGNTDRLESTATRGDTINQVWVSSTFFETLGVPVVRGRGVTDRDGAGNAVAVINQAAARKYFPSTDPIGKHFGRTLENPQQVEIVGVVRDAKYENVRDAAPPTLYWPFMQRCCPAAMFEVRTAIEPQRLTAAVREAVRRADPNLPIVTMTTQAEQIEARLAQEKLFAEAYALFGLLALALASIGLFGLMSYSVARRTNEIGIRMALGARRTDVMTLVMRESMTMVAAGIVIGLVVATGASRFVAAMLFGLTATDPLTLVTATLLLAAVAMLAGYLPARRAARVDPMVALRYE